MQDKKLSNRVIVKNLWEIFVSFLKIGSLMFGSGYTMLPLLSHEIVERRGWVTDEEMLDYFALAQCAPGVIAVNTAILIGQKRSGWAGGLSALLGVITAPILAILLVAIVLLQFWDNPVVVSAFNGVRVAVAALIATAVIRLFRANVKNWFGIALCVVGFLIAVFGLSPILVVAVGVVAGLVAGRMRK
ncbi:MAG TPA: chromate transporter [Candidatus Cryosericum sp.]|nr:chromate transporter [Candidatus Cryosericum sp.]